MPIFNNYGRSGLPFGRFAIVGIIAVVALISYFAKYEKNPLTGEYQPVAYSPQQEVALGLQAAPQMAQEMGGVLSAQRDPRAARVHEVGQKLVRMSKASQSAYAQNFNFYLLSDSQTVNAFALPGGQIFITLALYERLANEAQLAGVLGHEIGHVIHRHTSEQMAKGQLGQSLVGAVAMGTGDQSATYAAGLASKMLTLKYGRDDEIESDTWGLITMEAAGYDPSQMLAVMNTLKQASGGGGRGPSMLATHPDPDARIGRISQYLDQKFPQGVPANLTGGPPLR
ncbi:MAG TPA: M48 family metallopeptidase [Tepidisphaeraceae bacterium]|jgi:predicted Zn-dependent protease